MLVGVQYLLVNDNLSGMKVKRVKEERTLRGHNHLAVFVRTARSALLKKFNKPIAVFVSNGRAVVVVSFT